MANKSSGIFLILGLALSLVGALYFMPKKADAPVVPFNGRTELKCVLDIGEHEDTTRGLLSGYSYTLLSKFAKAVDKTVDIRRYRPDESPLDSLRKGAVDIVVHPFTGDYAPDSTLASKHIDSLFVWLVNERNVPGKEMIDNWISGYYMTDEYLELRPVFLKPYNPLLVAEKGYRKKILSPYDDIIRQAADSLEWDWKLLAALIFQESQFRLDARSYRGAEGLMQMMPATARKHNVDNVIDPEESIMSGVRYIRKLQKIAERRVTEKTDIEKVTLAAYHAGEGHVIDCFNYAAFKHRPCSNWEELKAIFPDMADDAILQVDTVKLGKFRSDLTQDYVEQVFAYYDAFNSIYAGPIVP